MDDNIFNILVIEDEVFASQYLIAILEDLGYKNIYEASSNEEAEDIVKKIKIDLIFMDINIKGSVDGINSSKILNKYYSIPIIYTTAYADSNTIKEATQTNVYGYLIKPFNENNVEASLLIALKKMNESINYQTKIEEQKASDIVDLSNNLYFDLSSKTLLKNEIPLKLTKKELAFVGLFVKNINKNISYETIQFVVWEDKDISDSTIRDSVSRLKKKIPELNIENVTGFGYILKLKNLA